MLVANYLESTVSPISRFGCAFGCDCRSSSPHRIKMPIAVEQENQPQRNHQNHQNHPLLFPAKKKNKTGKLRGSAAVINSNRITEYFPVRRSERKSKRAVLEEKQRDLENKVRCGIEDGLEVRQFIGKGRGVITTKKFMKGEYVVEYIGELIDLALAKKREAKYSKDENLGCYMYYFNHKNKHYCIDATPESNKLGRLVNHSRNGNLVTKIIEVDRIPHLVLIAKEDIPAGKEVTYDYGDRSRESIQNYPWLAT